MFWQIFWVTYFAGCLGFFVPMTRFMVIHMMDNETAHDADTGDIVMSAVCSLCSIWFWPLIIPGWWAFALIRNGTK